MWDWSGRVDAVKLLDSRWLKISIKAVEVGDAQVVGGWMLARIVLVALVELFKLVEVSILVRVGAVEGCVVGLRFRVVNTEERCVIFCLVLREGGK